MDAISLKPERKAQLEEYAQRHGQTRPSHSMKLWLSIWIGNARILRTPWKVSAGVMKM
jgi:hypothetical protein